MASEPTLSSLAALAASTSEFDDEAYSADPSSSRGAPKTKEQLRRHYVRALHKVIDEADIITQRRNRSKGVLGHPALTSCPSYTLLRARPVSPANAMCARPTPLRTSPSHRPLLPRLLPPDVFHSPLTADAHQCEGNVSPAASQVRGLCRTLRGSRTRTRPPSCGATGDGRAP